MTGITAMLAFINAKGKPGTVETLEGLMERLGAPDLTAAESQALRPRLFRLLEAIESETGSRSSVANASGNSNHCRSNREPCLAV